MCITAPGLEDRLCRAEMPAFGHRALLWLVLGSLSLEERSWDEAGPASLAKLAAGFSGCFGQALPLPGEKQGASPAS